MLHPASLGDGDQAGHSELAVGAAAPDAGFASLEGAAEGTPRSFVGWFHAMFVEEDEELPGVHEQRGCQIAPVAVATVEVTAPRSSPEAADQCNRMARNTPRHTRETRCQFNRKESALIFG